MNADEPGAGMRLTHARVTELQAEMANAWGGDSSWLTTGSKVAAVVADWLHGEVDGDEDDES